MSKDSAAVGTSSLSALETLRAMASKKPRSENEAGLPASMGDPAISGAKKVKAVVQLGLDPSFAQKAKVAASLADALKKAEADFSILEDDVRKYGLAKREAYNSTFKANVTTVCVPYQEESPEGLQTHYIQVICSNKYSVQSDVILNNQSEIGEHFDSLFQVETNKVLRPNTEGLLKGLLVELGIDNEQVETVMSNLFEETKKVKTRPEFEQNSKSVPENVQLILEQAVTRSQPGLKFETK